VEKGRIALEILEIKKMIREKKARLEAVQEKLEEIKARVLLREIRKAGIFAGGQWQIIKKVMRTKQVKNKYGRRYEYAALVLFFRDGSTRTIYLDNEVLELLKERRKLREEVRKLNKLVKHLYMLAKS